VVVTFLKSIQINKTIFPTYNLSKNFGWNNYLYRKIKLIDTGAFKIRKTCTIIKQSDWLQYFFIAMNWYFINLDNLSV